MVVQAGRTHLQTALPVTVGFWETGLHSRFVDSSCKAKELASEIPGKFTGAVGTSSAKKVLFKESPRHIEQVFMEMPSSESLRRTRQQLHETGRFLEGWDVPQRINPTESLKDFCETNEFLDL